MKTVFVDTNVMLDVLLKNEGLWHDSLRIFQLAEQKRIRAFVSASSMTDVFYVASKKLSLTEARQAIEKPLDLFGVVNVDSDDLRSALHIGINDFEDALQAHCAGKIKADALITRDVKGFAGTGIAVVQPVDFQP